MTMRICLDPGHGGWDPGATAVDGQPEKGFTLALALAVRTALTGRFDCEVVLTRDADEALTPDGNLGAELRARADVGNQTGANLFLSLHHDAASSPDARGGSLWIWRNHPESGVGHRPAIDPTSGQPNHDAPHSHEMGRRFIDPVRGLLAQHSIPWRSYGSPSGICAADFGVLRHSQGAGLLLECFFGSSPSDVAIARRPAFIPELAAAIAEGVARALNLPAAVPALAPEPAAPAPTVPDRALAPEPAVPDPSSPDPVAYPAALIINNVRHEGFHVVEGRMTGPLRPLLDELQLLGYRFTYDWRTRTLSVVAPTRNVASSTDNP